MISSAWRRGFILSPCLLIHFIYCYRYDIIVAIKSCYLDLRNGLKMLSFKCLWDHGWHGFQIGSDDRTVHYERWNRLLCCVACMYMLMCCGEGIIGSVSPWSGQMAQYLGCVRGWTIWNYSSLLIRSGLCVLNPSLWQVRFNVASA
jgi:hypothetical protein